MTDPSASDQAEGEFVPVAEAARRLNIGERRAYRLTSRLSDSERRVSDTKPRQTLVNVCALETLLSVEGESAQAVSDTASVRHVRQRPTVRHQSDDGPHSPDARDVLIEQLQIRLSDVQQDRDRLADALQREQETASKLADRIADADARLASVIAATRQIEPQRSEPEASRPETEPARADAATGAQEGQSRAKSVAMGHAGRRPWWAFWKQ